MDDLPTKEILKIRKEHTELFRVFQDDLRSAVKDVVKASEGTQNIEALAREVEDERIHPALNKIELAVKKSANPISRGLTATIGFTGVTVAELALTHNPAFSVGVSAAVNALGWLNAAQGNREDIASSQMYFLFQLTKAARKHSIGHSSGVQFH